MTTDTIGPGPSDPGSTVPAPPGRHRYGAQPWSGPKRRYDLVREFVIALLVVGVLSIGLALIFSSPDDKSVTLQRWATQNPSDFVLTAVTELDGTSTSASYGPPYNHASDGQSIFFLHLQKWAGVRIPVKPGCGCTPCGTRSRPSKPPATPTPLSGPS